ncbi:hypothetical protein CTI14_47420, partial [Methylobacterium radiotolerans]
LPFEPDQLAKVLSSHSEMAGVIIDSAGPSMVVDAAGAGLARQGGRGSCHDPHVGGRERRIRTGQVGIAEAQTADGRRFLQLFSHPLEVIALGRGDRPLPFEPDQLAKVLSSHSEMAGVIIDSAGPSMVV